MAVFSGIEGIVQFPGSVCDAKNYDYAVTIAISKNRVHSYRFYGGAVE